MTQQQSDKDEHAAQQATANPSANSGEGRADTSVKAEVKAGSLDAPGPAGAASDFEALMQERLEARIAELPTDPAVVLGLLERRHLLELSAWEACPEYVALKRALAARRPDYVNYWCDKLAASPNGVDMDGKEVAELAKLVAIVRAGQAVLPESRTINAADQAGACPEAGSTPASAAPIPLPEVANRSTPLTANRVDLLKRLRRATAVCSYIHPSELDGLERELTEANKRAEELAVELNGVRPYQKDGETAGQCVERNWTDSQNALGLFAKERIRSENTERELAEAIKDRDAHAEDSRQKDARIERLVAAATLEKYKSTTPVSATAPAHTDHPLRHFDRTCPACIAEGAVSAIPATSGAYRWIEDACNQLRAWVNTAGPSLYGSMHLRVAATHLLLAGVPTPNEDLGFNSPADIAARSTSGTITPTLLEEACSIGLAVAGSLAPDGDGAWLQRNEKRLRELETIARSATGTSK